MTIVGMKNLPVVCFLLVAWSGPVSPLCWFGFEFECGNGDCISFSKKCDDVKDCPSGEDEQNCGTTLVTEGTTSSTTSTSEEDITDEVNLTIYPENELSVKPGDDVTLICRDEGRHRLPVTWSRSFTGPHLRTQNSGRLDIVGITVEESGVYYCRAGGFYKTVVVHVDEPVVSSAAAAVTTSYPSIQDTTQVALVLTTDLCGCVGQPDCNCTCECVGKNCPSSTTTISPSNGCFPGEFYCYTGECIEGTKRCDNVEDCADGSDERDCAITPEFAPRPVKLPPIRKEVDCVDPSDLYAKKGFFSLTCGFIGYPLPLITWMKSGDRVPRDCVSSPAKFQNDTVEVTLTCLNFEQTMQGEYTCTGSNHHGSVEQAPPTLVKCKAPPPCAPGTMKVVHDQMTLCVECFCAGVSSTCVDIPATLGEITADFPDDIQDVFFHHSGEVGFVPLESTPLPLSVNMFERIKFCKLPHKFLGNQLKSYGQSLVLPIMVNSAQFQAFAPDVIIRGNGVTLSLSLDREGLNQMETKVQFWAEHWKHITSGTPDASRQDIMRALANLDFFGFRCEYRRNELLTSSNKVKLEVSIPGNATHGSPSFIEKCDCPEGYSGLSCQECSSGYKRDIETGQCSRKSVCPVGYGGPRCDDCDVDYAYIGGRCVRTPCNPSYTTDVEGSSCICKDNVGGEYCDECKPRTFLLHRDNPHGCISCYCSGLTNVSCSSSRRYRVNSVDTPDVGYNSSDGKSFWLLPKFTGSLTDSYGGYLVYTIKYNDVLEKQTSDLAVDILSENNVRLDYVNSGVDRSTTEDTKTWRVRMVEQGWLVNGVAATRATFMKAVSTVRAFYIQSPYNIHTGSVVLASVSLDTTADFGTDQALEVEQCDCPKEYEGRSCETCSHGHYRNRSTDPPTCVACADCHGGMCDPETGKCNECDDENEYDDTPEEPTPTCKPCPCNGNQKRCPKNYQQVHCQCKEGFFGHKCERAGPEKELKVTITPHRVMRKPHEVVNFVCTYESAEEMTIKFSTEFKDGRIEQVENVDKENMPVKEGFGMLKNASVTMKDGLAFVICTVSNKKQDKVGMMKATVLEGGEEKGPEIVNWMDEIKVQEDDDVDLTCEAKGDPRPSLTWFKQTSPDLYEKVHSTDGYKQLTEVQLDQNGTVYKCTATNHVAEDSRHLLLIVKERCPIRMTLVPDVYEGEEGDTVVLKCETAPENLHVTWSKEGSSFLSSGAQQYQETLTITSATLSDSGIYLCSARDDLGNVKTNGVSVQIQRKRVAASARILQQDVTIYEGDDLEVDCEVGGYPEPHGGWKMLNNREFLNNVRQHQVGQGMHRLSISYATVSNTDVYVCVATNWDSAKQRIAITVSARSPPKVSLSPPRNYVKTGEDVSLYCQVTGGVPSPVVTWGSSHADIDAWNINIRDNTLTIRNIEKKNEGRYYCSAKNTAGSDEAYATVEVEDKVKPRVSLNTSNNLEIMRGATIHISCLAEEGTPQPDIQWTRIDGYPMRAFTQSGFFRLDAADYADNGTYMCSGVNEAGSHSQVLSISVQFKPSVTVTPTSIEASKGDLIELTCKAVGNPLPHIHFRQEEANFKSSKRSLIGKIKKFGLEMFTEEATIRVKASERKTGQYVCTAENIHGTDVGYSRFSLRSEETITYARSVLLGTEVILTCPNMTDNVTWTKDDGKIRSDTCFVFPNKLVFNAVQVQDRGVYTCTSVKDREKHAKTILKVHGYVPKFDRGNQSYIQLHVNSTAPDDSSRIEITFRSTEPTGLIFLRNDNPQFMMQLFDHHLIAGPFSGRFLKLHKQLTLDSWHTLILQLTHDTVLLDLDGTDLEKGALEKPLVLRVGEVFHLGGTTIVNSNLRSTRQHPYKYSTKSGLSGCVSRLLVNDHEYNITEEASYSRKVSTCKRCAQQPCGEAGTCIDAPTEQGFSCICPSGKECPASCTGRTCQSWFDLCRTMTPCHNGGTCELGRGSTLACHCKDHFYGHRCQSKTLPSIQLHGDGWAQMSASGLRSKFGEEKLYMKFTSKTEDGLLLWQGNPENYLYLAVVQGRVRYIYQNQGTTLKVDSSGSIYKDSKHSLSVDRLNGTVTMILDNEPVGYSTLANEWFTNRVFGPLYVGGVPDIVETTNGLSTSNFKGCIHELTLDPHKGSVNFAEKTVRTVRSSKCQR